MSKPALKVVVDNTSVTTASKTSRQAITLCGKGDMTQMLTSGSLVHAVHTLKSEENLTHEDFIAFHTGIYGSRPPRRIPFANRNGASC